MRHGDTLTITVLIDDPVYLTEPFVLSRSWKLDAEGADSADAGTVQSGG